CQQGNTWPWTF
nr:immunoglobulin light chain junction region [Macaca mulatta]MOW11537.1 immunoglobulin light chain junction region [Macaca mulatta]MOW13092.1 immunoglobulin light chain junction region [Macaca mulatta]